LIEYGSNRHSPTRCENSRSNATAKCSRQCVVDDAKNRQRRGSHLRRYQRRPACIVVAPQSEHAGAAVRTRIFDDDATMFACAPETRRVLCALRGDNTIEPCPKWLRAETRAASAIPIGSSVGSRAGNPA
jgi:hypothetical protein